MVGSRVLCVNQPEKNKKFGCIAQWQSSRLLTYLFEVRVLVHSDPFGGMVDATDLGSVFYKVLVQVQ